MSNTALAMEGTMTTSAHATIQPISLKGTAYQRGLGHGETLRAKIQELVRVWQAELSAGFELDAGQVIHRFLQRTDFVSAIQKWTPDLLDEVRGIADGCGLSFDTILAFQLLDELWANGDLIVGEHCTAIGFPATAEEPAYLAETLDVETFRDGFQVVLHITDAGSGMEAFVASSAGLIGFNGINNKGVGVCVNALLPLNSRTDGLPVACIVRGVLSYPSAQQACDFLRRIPHACGQNYLVGGPDRVIDLECSANQVVQYQPHEWKDVVWHANMPLANDDYTPGFRAALDKQQASPYRQSSEIRSQSVEERLRQAPVGRRLEFIKLTLASRDSDQYPVCSIGDKDEYNAQIGLFSLASTIMKLSEDPEFYVSFTPVDPSSYTRLTFAKRDIHI
jgi:isopenicillin-N N-acyltransferase-like protein